MFRNSMFAVASIVSALCASGCTTTNSTLDTAQSFAPMPELAAAPVPSARPDSAEARASLAASVEDDVTVETVAFAPDQSDEVPNILAKEPAIPDAAIEVATAKPVNEAPIKGSNRDRECLMRVMYFESNRSSRDGQLAVGTVVMHRLTAGKWGNSVCSVVTARNQFAPGVMSRPMQGDTSDLASLADAIISGKRHPRLGKNVLFFHTAGLKFRYTNIRYVTNAGGNSFYYKAARRRA